jgi:hypothetical protein
MIPGRPPHDHHFLSVFSGMTRKTGEELPVTGDGSNIVVKIFRNGRVALENLQ